MGDNHRSTEAYAALGVLVSGPLLVVAASLYIAFTGGLCLSWLWEWFVTPFGVRSISIMHAGGLIMIYRFIITKHVKSDTAPDYYSVFLSPWLTLGAGFLVSRFV